MLNIHPGFHSRYKTNHLDTQKSVCEWVCALWDGILQSTYTYSIKSHRIAIKREAVSHLSHQQSIVLKKQNEGRLRNLSHYGRGCTLNENVQVLSRECEGVIATFLVDRPLMSDAVIYSSIMQNSARSPWTCLVFVEQVRLASVITRYCAW